MKNDEQIHISLHTRFKVHTDILRYDDVTEAYVPNGRLRHTAPCICEGIHEKVLYRIRKSDWVSPLPNRRHSSGPFWSGQEYAKCPQTLNKAGRPCEKNYYRPFLFCGKAVNTAY